jgi:hypothetical protein
VGGTSERIPVFLLYRLANRTMLPIVVAFLVGWGFNNIFTGFILALLTGIAIIMI